MSWILQNKFAATLLAGTLVLAGLLLYAGSRASSRYQASVAAFQEATTQVSSYERLALYPSRENLDGKTKALADYEETIGELVAGFEKFRTPASERVSPQELGNRLVAANERIASRFTEANVATPAGFYGGFEDYTGAFAQSGATPVLSHQLEIVEALLADLAAAKPASLINFVRDRQPEEGGAAFEPKKDAVARPHAFELTFEGTEASARAFVTSLVDTNKRFAIIRTLRIVNESSSAPKSTGALFAASAPAAVGPAAPFDGLFGGFFDDQPAADAADDEEGEGLEAPGIAVPLPPAPQPAAPQPGGTRILGQVAGNELVRVFVRFDVMEFLPVPTKETAEES
ncbi:MAG: Amuc_1100 family pilus-like protein [Luteolibacter sp.]